MIRADDRADPCVRVQRIADLDGLRPLGESCQKFVGNAGMKEKARAGVAAFASVEVCAEGRRIERGVHVGVREDELGIFAAKLHRDFLERRRSGRHGRPADAGRAREGDHVDVGMSGHRRADVRSVTCHDVADALGKARLGQKTCEMQGRGRSHFARLHDAGAAGGQRERQLLRDDQEREVPRRDDGYDADRLPEHKAQPVGAEIGVALARKLARQRRGSNARCRRRLRSLRGPGRSAFRIRASRAAPGSRGRGR